MRSAEAALALAKAEYERGLIRAPISGVVSNAPMTTGQAMQPNMMVAEIIALDPMLAVAEVAERQLGEIKVGDKAEVRLVTGQTAKGVVRYVCADREQRHAHLSGRGRGRQCGSRDLRRRHRRGRVQAGAGRRR